LCRETCGMMRTAKSCGPDAPTLAPSPRKAKSSPRAMVARKPGHQGARISRRATAQGRPECFCFTCMLVRAFSLCINAHETADAARTRSSPRPLSGVACALSLFGGRRFCKTSGNACRENENRYSVVIARRLSSTPIGDDRATRYSRAPMTNGNALEYWITRFRG
jgi:hypothetical protein